MEDGRKNRWYHLHLSTGIILSVLVAVFIVANCRQYTFIVMRGNSGVGDVKSERGWPYVMMTGATKFRYEPGVGFFDSHGRSLGRSDTDVVEDTSVDLNFDAHHGLINGGLLVGALLLGVIICELLNRLLHSLITFKKRDETINWR